MRKVVTKEWTKAKSAKTGFVVHFRCRNNSSFRRNILGLLCLWSGIIHSFSSILSIVNCQWGGRVGAVGGGRVECLKFDTLLCEQRPLLNNSMISARFPETKSGKWIRDLFSPALRQGLVRRALPCVNGEVPDGLRLVCAQKVDARPE